MTSPSITRATEASGMLVSMDRMMLMEFTYMRCVDSANLECGKMVNKSDILLHLMKYLVFLFRETLHIFSDEVKCVQKFKKQLKLIRKLL